VYFTEALDKNGDHVRFFILQERNSITLESQVQDVTASFGQILYNKHQ